MRLRTWKVSQNIPKIFCIFLFFPSLADCRNCKATAKQQFVQDKSERKSNAETTCNYKVTRMQPKINSKIGGSPVVVFRLHWKKLVRLLRSWGSHRAIRFALKSLLVYGTVDLIRSEANVGHERMFVSWIAHFDVSRCKKTKKVELNLRPDSQRRFRRGRTSLGSHRHGI